MHLPKLLHGHFYLLSLAGLELSLARTFGGGQIDYFDEVNHESRTYSLDTTTVEAEWLRELLMDLPVVEKPVPAILMNCDNQTVMNSASLL